jgi:hypothetical protein
MDWFFDGLGTMLLGIVLGIGGCATARVSRRKLSQRQRSRGSSTQLQAGRDIIGQGTRRKAGDG